MSGKSLILLGLGIGSLYTYFCITTHKDELYKELYPVAMATEDNESTTEETLPPTQEVVKTDETTKHEVVEKDYASFSFVNTKPYEFNALLDKNSSESEMIKQINQWCQAETCTNDIQFLDNIKEDNWSQNTLNLVSFMITNNISNASVSIKDNQLTVNGEVKDENEKEELEKLLNTYDPSLKIDNQITVAAEPIVTESNVTTQPIVTEPSNDDNKVKEAQVQIDDLLKNAVINFQLNSSKILPSSKKILDNVIKIINDLNIKVDLDIFGHTDARGSANYNKKLSQKRADSVKNYLFAHNINVRRIASMGYGEEKLIFEPNDKRNRRVEIYLKKGE